MTITAAWPLAWRISTEASFGAASPEGKADWHIGGNGGGANGWMDLPIVDGDGLSFHRPTISPTGHGGNRAFNYANPVKGADLPELGSLEFPVYPELSDRIFKALLGSVSRSETAGSAALASTAFASVATLDTQPDGTEQLKFVIASSTAASSAAINIIQNGVTVETITIGTNAGTVDGTYYSKGGYDGSVNAITFSVDGTVTSGMVTVSGVDYSTNDHTVSNSLVTLAIEQQERIEAGAGNSQYFGGVIVPTCDFAFDRNAADGLLTMTPTFHGKNPTEATKTAYGGSVGKYYRPIAAWNGAVNLDDSSYAEIVSASWTVGTKNAHYQVASGNQAPTGGLTGQIEITGEMTIIPADGSRFDDYLGSPVQLRDVEFDFITPHYVVDTTGYQVRFTFSEIYFDDYTQTRVSFGDTMAMGATVPFRAKWNTTDSGPGAITTRCRLPV